MIGRASQWTAAPERSGRGDGEEVAPRAPGRRAAGSGSASGAGAEPEGDAA